MIVTSVALAVLLVAGFQGIENGLRLGHWMQAQQQFSYEHEFIRRGLIGEIVRQVSFPNEPRPMYALSVVVYGCISALLASLAWSALAFLPRAARQAGTVLVLVLPFALPHVAFDLGRYDSFLYLLILPLVMRRASPPVAFAVVGVAGVLIHELFLIVQLPLLIAVLLSRGSWRLIARDKRVIGLLLAATVTMLFVATKGDMESMTMPEFRAELQEKVPGYDATSLGAPHRLLFDTPGSATQRTIENTNRWRIINSGLAVLPGIALLWLHRRLERTRRDDVCFAVAVAPSALLFVMGHDYPRWIALASFNLLIILLVRLRDDPPLGLDAEATRAVAALFHRVRAPVLLLFATVLAGPMGVVAAFPMWTDISDLVAARL